MGKKKANKVATQIPVKKVEKPAPQDSWIIWLTYAALIFVPLVISRISYDQFDIVKMAVFKVLVMGMLLLWVARILSKSRPISWSWRELLLVAFLVLGVASVITSIHIPTALHGKYKRYEGLLTFITYFSAYFVASQTFRRKDHVRTLLEVISFTGAFVAFYGILQFVGLDPLYWGDVPFEQRRSFSTFGNPDLLAGFLVIAFPCALASFFNDTKRRWWHGGAAFILAVGLITALTRSGWLGALVGLICIGVLLGRQLKNYLPELAAMGIVLAVVLVALTVYSAETPELSITSKFQGAFQLTSGTAANRFEIWKAGLLMAKDKPLFGQGLDTFRLASEEFETKAYVKLVQGGTVSDNAHNYFIQLAAGAGPLAAILLYLFFGSWFVRMVRVRSSAPDDESRLFISGAAAAVAGYLATMLLGISIIGASSVFWLLMGALSGLTQKLTPEYKDFDISKWSPGAKLAVALPIISTTVVIAAVSVAMYASDIYFVSGLRSEGVSVQQTEYYMNKSMALYPGNGRIASQMGQMYMGWANQAIQAEKAQDFQYLIGKATESFERARDAEPLEIDYAVFLANVNGNRGQVEQGLAILEDVTQRRPYSVPGHYLTAQFLVKMDRKEEAADHYELVYELAPGYMDVPSLLADLYKDIGNDAKAAAYRKVVEEKSAPVPN